MDSRLDSADHISYEEHMKRLHREVNIWLLAGFFGMAGALVMAFLGVAFLIMLFGAVLAFWRLALIYDPAYRLLLRLLRLKALPEHLTTPRGWHIAYSIIMMIAPLLMVGFGIGILHFAGFCKQNFICIFVEALQRLRPAL